MQQEQSCCGLRSTRANTPRRYLAKAEHQFLISNGRFRPVFNDEMEKALADYLLELSRRFFGMTTNQVRSLAFEFAEWNGLPYNFDRDLKMAGVDWLAGYLAKAEHQFLISNGRFRPVFNDEMEKALADYLLELSRRFFGMTTNQVRSLAFEFAEWNGLPHNFDRDLKMAGVDWLAGFRERHKNTLALRSPEMTSLGRIQVFNEVQTRQFFTLLGDLYKNHKFLPMYNVDETGVPTVQTKLPKVLSAKGAKRVAKVVSSERGKTVTLVCSMNAAGNFIPSAYVFRMSFVERTCNMIFWTARLLSRLESLR